MLKVQKLIFEEEIHQFIRMEPHLVLDILKKMLKMCELSRDLCCQTTQMYKDSTEKYDEIFDLDFLAVLQDFCNSAEEIWDVATQKYNYTSRLLFDALKDQTSIDDSGFEKVCNNLFEEYSEAFKALADDDQIENDKDS